MKRLIAVATKAKVAHTCATPALIHFHYTKPHLLYPVVPAVGELGLAHATVLQIWMF